MIRETARFYAQEKLLPCVTGAYLEEKTDRDLLTEIGDPGLTGVMRPKNTAVPMQAAWRMAGIQALS